MAFGASFAVREAAISTPVYPVILCGGVGARLWPASRPWHPKPFLELCGGISSFRETVRRARAVAPEGELVVVAGKSHAALVAGQLDLEAEAAQVLLEPMGRDTAPAITAAAIWIAERHPEAVMVVLSADHAIADSAAFESAIAKAVAGARQGGIITLGVVPQCAETAYGYILAGSSDRGLKPILSFEEKPNPDRAEALVAAGALWNSGIFVATADTILTQMMRFAPEVTAKCRASVRVVPSDSRIQTLGPAFAEAPRVAFDRAVMERTSVGLVLPVAFAWSDLGSWSAVHAVSAKDQRANSIQGDVRLIDADRVLVRAEAGVRVAVVGISDVAVVATADAILVSRLDHDGSAVGLEPSQKPGRFASRQAAAESLSRWLRTSALPLWATIGVDPVSGAFREGLTLEGAPDDPRRRSRVQARQVVVFASAHAAGFPGPWLAIARRAHEDFLVKARRPDGLFVNALSATGEVLDPTAYLYEHAFQLLALAALRRADSDSRRDADLAQMLLEGLAPLRHANGGFREIGPEPFQANALMHLLEAAMAWDELGVDPVWGQLADEIAELALARFVDPGTGAISEFYDDAWAPRMGAQVRIEPGHQFEWAELLARWGAARGIDAARVAAARLFDVGGQGYDPSRGIVVDALWGDLSPREFSARLWPQTEFLKAGVMFGDDETILIAANAVAQFLENPVPGVWRERRLAGGDFLEESAPATSLYHLTTAILALMATASRP